MFLLEEGGHITSASGCSGSALQRCSVGGYKQVVKLLLNEGANVNAQGGQFNNALQAASLQGHDQSMKLLLDEGADVNTEQIYRHCEWNGSIEQV